LSINNFEVFLQFGQLCCPYQTFSNDLLNIPILQPGYRLPEGYSGDQLCHARSDAYSAEQVILNKQQIWCGGADLPCYPTWILYDSFPILGIIFPIFCVAWFAGPVTYVKFLKNFICFLVYINALCVKQTITYFTRKPSIVLSYDQDTSSDFQVIHNGTGGYGQASLVVWPLN